MEEEGRSAKEGSGEEKRERERGGQGKGGWMGVVVGSESGGRPRPLSVNGLEGEAWEESLRWEGRVQRSRRAGRSGIISLTT